MSQYRSHGEAEQVQTSYALSNPDAQKASNVQLLEHNPHHNESPQDDSTITAPNSRKSILRKGFCANIWAHITNWFVDWWMGELLAILLSIVAFLTTIVVLHKYDDHPLPKWPHGITLNFVVSVLATVSKSSLLLVVASALGQSKWLWMSSKQRRLQDLQIFDEASRGPLGASKLLASRGGLSWASIGATVTLLCLVFDPFIQGLIKIPQRVVYKHGPASLLKSVEDYPILFPDKSIAQNYPLLNTVSDAVFNSNPLPEIQPRCPSANCTWPLFTSLGFCFKCQDISQPLRDSSTHNDTTRVEGCGSLTGMQQCSRTTRTYNYTIPMLGGRALKIANTTTLNSWFMVNFVPTTGQIPTFWVVPILWNSIVNFNYTDGSSVPTAAMTVLIRTSTQLADAGDILAADLCGLSFCAQRRNVSVTVNQPSSMILQTVHGTEVGHAYNDGEHQAERTSKWLSFTGDGFNMTFPSIVNQTDSSSAIDLIGWEADGWEADLQAFVKALAGSMTGADNIAGGPQASSNLIAAFNASSNISLAMDNIATALTNYVRDASNVTLAGQASQVESFVHVNWAWITLPAILVAAGMLFLILAMFESQRRGARVWKSSELALLFHGFETSGAGVGGNGAERLDSRSQMERVAEGIKVRMVRTDEDGWVLRQEGNAVERST